MTQPEFAAKAKEMLRSASTRVTHGRVAVLAALLEARRALTHSEVEARLESLHSIDRVTVYRVLDCLMELGLAHRLAGDDRVWRFTAEMRDHTGGHPHFKCNACGDVICLDDDQTTPKVSLPAGYKGEEIELTVKGKCASCAPTQRVAKRGRPAARRASTTRTRPN